MRLNTAVVKPIDFVRRGEAASSTPKERHVATPTANVHTARPREGLNLDGNSKPAAEPPRARRHRRALTTLPE